MELKGDGFILRTWKEGDEISLQKNADNIKIFNCLTDAFPSPYTMDHAISWVDMMINQNPVLIFVIDVTGEVDGVIGLDPKNDVYRKTALIGYWLKEELWGSGIMPEAVKLVTQYAFEHLDFIRLQAGIFGKNPRSMRVLEKAGYQKEGVCRNAIIKNGEVMDEHIYAILKP